MAAAAQELSQLLREDGERALREAAAVSQLQGALQELTVQLDNLAAVQVTCNAPLRTTRCQQMEQ